MADEQIPQNEQASQPPVEEADEEFDWNQFFSGDDAGTPTPPPPVAEEDTSEEDDLRKQLAQVQADSAKALEMSMATQTQTKMQNAVEAWKAQASPAEQELADLLLDSKTPEELQKNAEIVKRAAAKLDASSAERQAKDRHELELKMQKEFGIPIPPTFTPVPEEEKVNQLLKDGDLDAAASAMLKGVFNT